MEPIYTLENSDYVLMLGDKRIVVGPEVSICFDRASNVLLKHGAPELVQGYAATARKRLVAAGHQEMAADLICLTGAFSLEDLNKVVSICDYIGRFYARLVTESNQALSKEAV